MTVPKIGLHVMNVMIFEHCNAMESFPMVVFSFNPSIWEIHLETFCFIFKMIKIKIPWHLPYMAFQHVTEQLVLNGNASDLQLGGAQVWDKDYPGWGSTSKWHDSTLKWAITTCFCIISKLLVIIRLYIYITWVSDIFIK